MPNTHHKRWITGIVAVPVVYLLVAAGGGVFSLMIGAVSVVTLWEYYRAVFKADADVLLLAKARPSGGVGRLRQIALFRGVMPHLSGHIFIQPAAACHNRMRVPFK